MQMDQLPIKSTLLVFGLVAPIGVDTMPAKRSLKTILQSFDYTVIEIKISKFFSLLSRFLDGAPSLNSMPELSRYESYINFGNFVRQFFGNNSILSALAIAKIMAERVKLEQNPNLQISLNVEGQQLKFTKIAFIVDQIKRPEEAALFRFVYRELFFRYRSILDGRHESIILSGKFHHFKLTLPLKYQIRLMDLSILTMSKRIFYMVKKSPIRFN